MNIVFLNSLAIPAASCQSTNLSKEPLQSIYDFLPDPSREQMQCNHEENGKYTDYHKARTVLMLIRKTLMPRQTGCRNYRIR